MSYPTKELYRPIAGATVGVWRVDLPGGPMVLKQIHCGTAGDHRWPTSPDPHNNYYWRREADLLMPGSPLRRALDEVPGGIRPVRCHGVFDRPDGTVALWLENLTGGYGPHWPLDRYRRAATQLGRSQAALADSAVLARPELSRTWLREYAGLHRDTGDALDRPGIWDAAQDCGIFGRDVPARFSTLWAALPHWLDLTDALPRTLTHFDFHPGNLFDADGETIVIDWAYAGVGPVGLDAACLVFEAIFDYHREPADVAELFEVVAEGYATGYAEAGGRLDAAEIRRAMIITTAVKLGWTIPATLTAVAENRPTLNDKPLAEGARAWAGAGNFLMNLVDDVDDVDSAPTSPAKGPNDGPLKSEEKP